MKLLFCGLGSIGQRHLKNAAEELKTRGIPFSADALRHSEAALPEETAGLLCGSYTGFRQLAGDYDVAFITNPSALHYETLREVIPLARAVFIEKPLFTDPRADLGALNLREDGIYYAACPLRRSPVIQKTGELLRDPAMKPTAARAVCSSYLPEWRASDYRKSYSASREMGGGVRLDLIHEWDYLTALFGKPKTVKSFSGKFSDLEIQSDDTAVYIAEYPGMLLSLQLDYTGRAARRELELYCGEDTITADVLRNEIRFQKSGRVIRFREKTDVHRAEMRYFLDLVSGVESENINTPQNAMETLRIALAE